MPGRVRWAWLPIPSFLLAILVLRAVGPAGPHESQFLITALNLVCSMLVSLLVAYLIARSFLVRGTPGLLLLGCGVLLWGLAGVVAVAAAGGDPNTRITIHNGCAWLSGLCHLIGVVVSQRTNRTLSPTALWLPTAYVLAAGGVVVVTLGTLWGALPIFFVQGQGGTPVRHLVLTSAIAMFALTAILLGLWPSRPASAFVYWYALALGLIAVGLFGVMLQSTAASVLGWTGRAAQFVGGLYMLIAAAASVRETQAWGISLEAALRGSEERLRLALEAARMGTWDWDLASDRLVWNDEHYRILGYEPGERTPTYQAWMARVHPEDRAATEAILRHSMEQGMECATEFRVLAPDGSLRWVEARGRFDLDDAGRAVHSYGVMLNITERKQAEEALRDLNTTLESRVAERTAELEQRTRQLQKLALELSQAEDRERQRIAVFLHEDLQQQIAGAKFHLGLLNGPTKEDPQRQAVIGQIDEMLRGAIEKSRSLSHELSPAVLHHNDLGEALRWLAAQMRARHGLAVHVDDLAEVSLRSDALAVFLFRAAQEILLNVIRHAGVTDATVHMARRGRYVRLSVSDQGRGFDPEGLRQSLGFGLLSIRERSELLGGRMTIRSAEGRGSMFHIIVPDV